jgi:hypothetical protein
MPEFGAEAGHEDGKANNDGRGPDHLENELAAIENWLEDTNFCPIAIE